MVRLAIELGARHQIGHQVASSVARGRAVGRHHHRRSTARRPWRSTVACAFDADCAGDPALVDGNRQAWAQPNASSCPT